MMFFQFKASYNYLSIYHYYQKWIVNKTRKEHIRSNIMYKELWYERGGPS